MPGFYIDLMLKYLINHKRGGGLSPPGPTSKSALVNYVVVNNITGAQAKMFFERRTSTESEAFSLFICFEATKFVLLSVFTL